jgi:hypothetical protein
VGISDGGRYVYWNVCNNRFVGSADLSVGSDTGRDMALYLGRRLCGMKLAELAEAVDLRNYGMEAINAKRYELRLAQDRAEKARMKQVLKLLNCES